MLRNVLKATVILVSWACAAIAQEAEDQVTTFSLDNGMEVVVIEDHRAPVVVHMVWYKAGSADEPAGSSGVAHFLEHLLFKGTKTLEPGELSRVVAENGGSDNAFTSYDYTAYYQRIASDRLELMMRMESDRMVNLQLDEGDIATERAVIIEERNQRTENDPSALFREQNSAALYMNHRYGVPVIGWRHEMEGLNLDQALAYYKRNYAPNNAVLVVAGDVEAEDVRQLADTYYGALPANPDLTDRARPQEPRQLAERRLVFEDPRVAQPYVMRSYLAPERNAGDQKDAAALVILSEILGGGQTSVLTRKLAFDQKLAVYAGAYYDAMSLDQSNFGLIVVPAPGVTLQQAEDAMDQVVAEFMVEGVDPAQLERIKFQIHAQQIYARDNVDGLARTYGSALTSGLTIQDVQDWPDVLAAVTANDIMEAARKVFDRKSSVTGWLRQPQEAAE
ncbi:M16 family metallopeptidase [Pseudoprimorskyibacter insulae]|uniref:Putative zinc protease n=1 Tax=Pseudoprimorskyibacter insulae TaxID=1695997 RepID=A0A2R8AVE4_9RHOB|nr:pitrilysin family protein [Pseudoprimorskyibacter insulae]SPF79897.1 putative zinc protease [Pseudoprimorskyibacter insulae]